MSAWTEKDAPDFGLRGLVIQLDDEGRPSQANIRIDLHQLAEACRQESADDFIEPHDILPPRARDGAPRLSQPARVGLRLLTAITGDDHVGADIDHYDAHIDDNRQMLGRVDLYYHPDQSDYGVAWIVPFREKRGGSRRWAVLDSDRTVLGEGKLPKQKKGKKKWK